MLFTEFLEDVESDSKLFDLNMMKINAYCERAFREYEINMKESEYKVLTESGTEDDLDYLFEAAKESYGSKLKKAGSKIIENLKKFAASVSGKIKSFFSKKEKNIDNIAKKFSSSPKGKNAKVKSLNKKKADSIFKQTEAKLKKASIAAKHGKADENTFKKIMSEHKKAMAAVGTIMISAATAFGILKHKNKNTNYDIVVKGVEDDFNTIYDTYPAEYGKTCTAYFNSYARLEKEKIAYDMDYIKSLFSRIVETAKNFQRKQLPNPDKSTSSSVVGESVNDELEDFSIFDEYESYEDNDLFEESEDYDDDEDIYEESEFDDLFEESEDYDDDEGIYEESEFDDVFGDDK